MLSETKKHQIIDILKTIYSRKINNAQIHAILNTIDDHAANISKKHKRWNEKDILLITYGDSIKNNEEYPLKTLHRFLKDYLKESINCVHVLPFFPYSSDDGFSVIDYYMVNPVLGSWKEINNIARDFDLMADLVINHVSSQHQWFKNYLDGKAPFTEYFIETDPAQDFSAVVRPRSSDLLTSFETAKGEKHVWSTFSDDQVDLNFSNPEVFIEMLRVLLFYLEKGMRIIRMDAIAYLWKEIGTSCIHLPQTHAIVKLFRMVMDEVAPGAVLLTETNVPNKENLSYFGNNDEAHMIYQFSLPPLLLHALNIADSSYLNQWLASMPDPGENCTYLNFTASHDGIGVRPLEGLLPYEEITRLLNDMKNFGGLISTKSNEDGSESPYEINITYFDALKGTSEGEDKYQSQRFISSQAIMMSLKGIPAFYIHSLTATQNDLEGVAKNNKARSINRKKWDQEELTALLKENNVHNIVFNELKHIMAIRKSYKVFHPNSEQEVVDLDKGIFAVRRKYGNEVLYAISSLSKNNITTGLAFAEDQMIPDLISTQMVAVNNIQLKPYQTIWLLINFPN